MTMHHLPFGVLLRRWREQRRLTQADLALAANSSTRHLSCLETGKSQPSRTIINRLTELLDVPLRDRNTLLLAAGFAPAYEETSIGSLEAAKAAMDRVLEAHKPYPALAQLSRLGGCKEAKPLIFHEVTLEGLHYRLGARESSAGPIFVADWAGTSSLSLSRIRVSSRSGWV